MRLATILASLLALLLSVAWLVYKPAFDSAVAVAVCVAALLSSFFLKRERGTAGQSQHVAGSSVGIQAGRDASVQDVKNK